MDSFTVDRRQFYEEIGVTLENRADQNLRHSIKPEPRTHPNVLNFEHAIEPSGSAPSLVKIHDVCSDETSDVSTEAMTTPEFWDALEESRPLPPDEGEAFSSNSVYALIGSVVSEDQENYHPGQSSSNNPYSSLNDFDVVRMPPDKRQILSHNVAGGDKDVGGNRIESEGDKSPVEDVHSSQKRKIIDCLVERTFSDATAAGKKLRARSSTDACGSSSASSLKRNSLQEGGHSKLRRSKRLEEKART
ncbi:hypothetical protein N7513_001884 [Penicillium frequentans]|nr:hypothetical protein N7513_001884 [Penicillium glabrum]